MTLQIILQLSNINDLNYNLPYETKLPKQKQWWKTRHLDPVGQRWMSPANCFGVVAH